MAEATTDVRSTGEAAIERTGPEPPAQSPGAVPTEVLLGAGGDPLIFGLPIFVVGSISLGLFLSGYLPAAALAGLVPILGAATSIGLFIATRWAIGLGLSIVAAIFGIFTGFWGSFTLLIIGLTHNWFAVPPTAIVHTELTFYISWDIIIFFLLIPVLRLPAVYIGIIAFVVVALTLVILGLEYPGSVSTFDHLAAISVFIFAGFGGLAFLNVGSIAMGGPAQPSLGPPLLK